MDHTEDHGKTFVLRYMGCIAINASMRTLEFKIRSDVTKECITRVCESANMIQVKKRKVDKQIRECLPGAPNLERSGENVYLTVSPRHLVVTNLNNPEILFDHPLADVSFASAGDEDTADFVAYVGKDERNGRRCYIFECSVGQAHEVITTIGQAFTTSFEQVSSTPVRTIKLPGVPQNSPPMTAPHHSNGSLAAASASMAPVGISQNHAPEPPPRVTLVSSPRSPALIDLNTPTPPPVASSYVNTPSHFFGEPAPAPLLCVRNLQSEHWFHGRMSREEAEALLKTDGEFLVRVSTKDPNQVVLTGMQNGVHKHLMLIDEEGKVRTKDREFDSVSHLIEHHRNSNLPITSAESALLLRFPVTRRN